MCASVMGKKAFLRRKMLLSTSKTFAQGLVLPAGIMKTKMHRKPMCLHLWYSMGF